MVFWKQQHSSLPSSSHDHHRYGSHMGHGQGHGGHGSHSGGHGGHQHHDGHSSSFSISSSSPPYSGKSGKSGGGGSGKGRMTTGVGLFHPLVRLGGISFRQCNMTSYVTPQSNQRPRRFFGIRTAIGFDGTSVQRVPQTYAIEILQ